MDELDQITVRITRGDRTKLQEMQLEDMKTNKRKTSIAALIHQGLLLLERHRNGLGS